MDAESIKYIGVTAGMMLALYLAYKSREMRDFLREVFHDYNQRQLLLNQ